MTKHLVGIISVGLSAAVSGIAQEPIYPPAVNPAKTNPTKGSKETVEQKKVTTDSGTKKTSTDTLTGKVETYEPNKWIRVTTPGKVESSRTINLQGKDITAHVKSTVKAGTWVSVVERVDADGHKTITVEPSEHGAQHNQ